MKKALFTLILLINSAAFAATNPDTVIECSARLTRQISPSSWIYTDLANFVIEPSRVGKNPNHGASYYGVAHKKMRYSLAFGWLRAGNSSGFIAAEGLPNTTLALVATHEDNVDKSRVVTTVDIREMSEQLSRDGYAVFAAAYSNEVGIGQKETVKVSCYGKSIKEMLVEELNFSKLKRNEKRIKDF